MTQPRLELNQKKKVSKIDKKRKQMMKDLEGKLGKGQLQITEGKGEDEESQEEDEVESCKGKELIFAKPKTTKQEKIVIIDPKLKENLKKGIKKDVTPPSPKPKRRVITRSKAARSTGAKEKESP